MKYSSYVGKNFIAKAAAYLCIGGALFVFLFCYIAAVSVKTEKFTVDRTFYFLAETTEEESVAAVSQLVYNSGGAGYMLVQNERTYTVLASYNSLLDAQTVANAMARRGKSTEILPITIGTFYFTTRAKIKVFRETEGAVNTLLQCADILYLTANKLESLEYTQREGREAVKELDLVLKGLQQNCSVEDTKELLSQGREKCAEIKSGIIYAKDLRYLQLQLTEGVYNLQSIFSL